MKSDESDDDESDDASDNDESDSDESGSDETGSDDDASDDETEKPKRVAPVSKKRGAEAAEPGPAKKVKGDTADGAVKTLQLRNLSYNVDEEWLTREMDGLGEITGVRIITDRNTGRSKG